MTAETAETRIPGSPDPWWESSALTAIAALAKTGRPFTAADLEVDAPDHPCRWGSAFAKAKQLGLVRKVGYTASRRTGRKGGVCAQWQGPIA